MNGSAASEGPPLAGARLLLVLDSLAPGGTETSSVLLAPHLRAAGAEVRFAVLEERPTHLDAELLRAGVALVHLPGDGWPRKIPPLRRLLRRYRPHLVHSALFNAGQVSRLAALGLPPLLLHSLVNDSYHRRRFADPRIRPWRLRMLQGLDILTARLRGDHFHAVSEVTAAAGISALRLDPRSVTVVYRGRPSGGFEPADAAGKARARRRLGLPADGEVILNVARQYYAKGQDLLLHAAVHLAQLRPAARIYVAGAEGPASAELAALQRRLGVEDRVRFLGVRDDIADWLAAADVMLFPSRWEGLPGAVIEAQASALPVIAADIPSLAELSAAGGVRLVPPEDPRGLAQATAALLADPAAAAALGDRGRRAFLQNFTLKASVDGMIGLYAQLLASPRRRRWRREPR